MPHEPRRIILLCGAVAVVLAGISFLAYRSFSTPAETPQVVELSQQPAGQPLMVYVAGAVKKPGVYELRRGARLYDAVKAAGGELPYADLSSINLAEPVEDGTKIAIPLAPDKASTALRGLVNVNAAGEKELETLPGIGEVTARRIIEYREEHGPFQTKEDLTKVKSISKAKLAKFADKITL